MGFVIAATILIVTGMFLFLLRDARNRSRMQRRILRILEIGQAGVGQILRMEPTGKVAGTRELPVLELRLDVEVSVPGKIPYVVKTRQLVDQHRVASVQPRQTIFLRVDPKNPRRIALTDTPGEDDASYREASGARQEPATPLFCPQRVRQTDAVLVLVLAMTVLSLLVISLSSVNWAAFSPPPGGFCAAALRCCERIPVSPGEESVRKLMSPGFLSERCSVSRERGDTGCQGIYEHYRKEAQNHQIACD